MSGGRFEYHFYQLWAAASELAPKIRGFITLKVDVRATECKVNIGLPMSYYPSHIPLIDFTINGLANICMDPNRLGQNGGIEMIAK